MFPEVVVLNSYSLEFVGHWKDFVVEPGWQLVGKGCFAVVSVVY